MSSQSERSLELSLPLEMCATGLCAAFGSDVARAKHSHTKEHIAHRYATYSCHIDASSDTVSLGSDRCSEEQHV